MTSRARSARPSCTAQLATLFVDRGVRIDRTYQLNFGGNTDFLNMLERERLESKKISKTNAVTSMIPYELDHDNVHVGPSDHVPWLTDRKWCYIRMEGTTFGDVPLNVEVKLEVWDSPNSAGVMIDAIRCAKIALDRKLSGPIVGPSSYFFKTPPKQFRDDICREKVEAFIKGEDKRINNDRAGLLLRSASQRPALLSKHQCKKQNDLRCFLTLYRRFSLPPARPRHRLPPLI